MMACLLRLYQKVLPAPHGQADSVGCAAANTLHLELAVIHAGAHMRSDSGPPRCGRHLRTRRMQLHRRNGEPDRIWHLPWSTVISTHAQRL
jgi:hypothetical protein